MESPPQLIHDTNCNQTDRQSRLLPSGLPTALPTAQAALADKGAILTCSRYTTAHMKSFRGQQASPQLALRGRIRKATRYRTFLVLEWIDMPFCTLRHSHLTAIEYTIYTGKHLERGLKESKAPVAYSILIHQVFYLSHMFADRCLVLQKEHVLDDSDGNFTLEEKSGEETQHPHSHGKVVNLE
jgi:hypothetical protein